jgi:hypothetical protein
MQQQKFKVGDAVRVRDDSTWTQLRGKTVRIIDIWPEHSGVSGYYGTQGCYVTDMPYPGMEETHYSSQNNWKVWDEDIELAPAAQPTVASDLKVTPQARAVLRYLKANGEITPMKALIVLGIPRLASCIHELRKKAGYMIRTEVRDDERGHRYGRYVLYS